MGQIITQKPAGIGTAFQQEREFEAKLQAIESEARLGALSEVENIVGKIVANFVMPSGTQARRLKMAAVEKLASDANAMANRFPANPKAREVARRITLKLSEIYKK